MKTNSYPFVLAAVITFYCYEQVYSQLESPCVITHKNTTKGNYTSQIYTSCFEQFPMIGVNGSETQFGNTTEDLENQAKFVLANANNCALKCLYENLNETTPEGRLDTVKVKEDFAQLTNSTEDFNKKLNNILEKCANQTEEKLLAEGGYKKNLCKYHTLIGICHEHEVSASQDELNQLCLNK